MQLISKHDPSTANAGRGTSRSIISKSKSKSNSTINNLQIKLDRLAVKSRSRSSSYGAHKRKESGKVARTASSGAKRARSTGGSGTASTKVTLDQVTRLTFKEAETPRQNIEPRPSLSEYPYRDSSHVSSELEDLGSPTIALQHEMWAQ